MKPRTRRQLEVMIDEARFDVEDMEKELRFRRDLLKDLEELEETG